MDLLICWSSGRDSSSPGEIAERLWAGRLRRHRDRRQHRHQKVDRRCGYRGPAGDVETVAGALPVHRAHRHPAGAGSVREPVGDSARAVAVTQEPSRRWRAAAAAVISLVAPGLRSARCGEPGRMGARRTRTTIAVLRSTARTIPSRTTWRSASPTRPAPHSPRSTPTASSSRPDRPLQHHQNGRRDRPGTGVGPGRRDGTPRERLRVTAALIRVGDQEHLVAGLRARDHQRVGVAAGREHGDRRTDPRPPVAGRRRVAINRQTAVPEAYDAYLRGRFLQNRRHRVKPPGRRGLPAGDRADPNYALAWSNLRAPTWEHSQCRCASRRRGSASRAAADRALRANRARRHAVRGWLRELDPGLGLAGAERGSAAITVEPGSVQAHRPSATSCRWRLSREAEASMARARLDPLDSSRTPSPRKWPSRGATALAAIRHARQPSSSTLVLDRPAARPGLADDGQPTWPWRRWPTRCLSGGNSKPIRSAATCSPARGGCRSARDPPALAARSRRYVPPYAFALVHAGSVTRRPPSPGSKVTRIATGTDLPDGRRQWDPTGPIRASRR